jgi:UDP-glucose 4-epimerase
VTVLITGGLGYIGSHITRLFEQRGRSAVIIDDESTGVRSRANDTPVLKLDLSDPASPSAVARVLRDYEVSTVIHLAAKKRSDESITRPLWYYSQNLNSLLTLLKAMSDVGTRQLVFSSSAAVYGIPTTPTVSETDILAPINPYGETKVVGERLVRAAAVAGGLSAVSLRYFNVAGAGWDDLGDIGANNLLPATVERIRSGARPLIHGDDYSTPDGTCVRDYIHVLDLAEAHIAAVDYVARRQSSIVAFNVGTGHGTSVRELVTAVSTAMATELTAEVGPRRQGDPASVVAATDLIRQTLGWHSRLGLSDMISSTLSAWSVRPS